jgi:hypothetical protein
MIAQTCARNDKLNPAYPACTVSSRPRPWCSAFEEAAEEARKKALREAARKSHRFLPETLELASYAVLHQHISDGVTVMRRGVLRTRL